MPKGIRGWTIFVLAQLALTAALKLVFKLLDNALMGWSDDQIAAYFGIQSPTATTVFNWGFPFALAAMILWGYHIIHNWPQTKRRARYQEREIGLIETMWWVAEQSAWGRWQAAQRPDWSNEQHRFITALSFVRTAALNGDLSIRARLKNSVEYLDVPRDFWRSAYIGVQPDKAALWKPVIQGMGSVTIPDYDNFIMERSSVQLLWPRTSLEYEWAILKLKFRAKLKRMKEKPPTIPETVPEANVEPPAQTVQVVTHPPSIEIVQKAEPFTPPATAPDGWEKLFAVGDDGKSIWLRFLPDNKHYRRDTLILIVFGHKILRSIDKVRVAAAHAAVEKSIDNAPAKPFDENPWNRVLRGLPTMIVDRDYGSEAVPDYLKRVGLAQGGMYQLTEWGESQAKGLMYDLISRA